MNDYPTPSPTGAPTISLRRAISRGGSCAGRASPSALPLLESMRPAFAKEDSPAAPGAKPRRMLAICNNLSLLPERFFPTGTGLDYTLSPYLEIVKEHRKDFTVFSGVSHPNVDGGHPADVCFLTAAPRPGGGSFRNTISLDQYVAERIGILTRFPSLTLAVNTQRRSLSCTGTGVAIPPEDKAADVFKQLFLQGTQAQVDAQVRKLDTGRTILDAIAAQAKSLQAEVGPRDRDRLDQYFTSVRELEHRLQESRGWELKPKPAVKAPAPVDPSSPAEFMAKIKVMFDLARLALETDSTRAVTLMLDGVATPAPNIPGTTITDGYHNLSHHGKAEDKVAQIRAIDEWHMKLLGGLLTELKGVREEGASLLDRTMVLYGSNLGDASTHVTTNLPVLLAGGGFRHGQHLAFDTERNYPLPNLFVSMLQRFGIEADRFASSTGTMRGLELA